jgi:hypothetical protein
MAWPGWAPTAANAIAELDTTWSICTSMSPTPTSVPEPSSGSHAAKPAPGAERYVTIQGVPSSLIEVRKPYTAAEEMALIEAVHDSFARKRA